MADLINKLPGVELPVGEVTSRLASMWETGPTSSPAEFRALQMNVVLHFGLDVTPAEAQERFEAIIRFAQRYPSRIIVLCPTQSIKDGSMDAKLYSQCFIGDSLREMCCCEALMLAYKSEDYGYLSNQVSIWLEGDLPTYHWFCGVPTKRIRKYYDNLLVGVRRCLYDSSYETEDLGALDWPDPSKVRDLAYARLLPVRQAIGQFLSGYEIADLSRNLESVVIHSAPEMCGEAKRLLGWVRCCLVDCEKRVENGELKTEFSISDELVDDCPLAIEFKYSDNHYFRWKKFKEGSLGEIEAYLGKQKEHITTRVKPLPTEQSIAEALFF